MPADDNSAVVSISKMLKSRNNINVLVAGKTPEPRYFSLESARKQLENGGIFVFDSWKNQEVADWNLISEDDEPDLILAASGDYVFKETVAALQVLLHDVAQVKIRLVYVQALCGKELELSKMYFRKATLGRFLLKISQLYLFFTDTLKLSNQFYLIMKIQRVFKLMDMKKKAQQLRHLTCLRETKYRDTILR